MRKRWRSMQVAVAVGLLATCLARTPLQEELSCNDLNFIYEDSATSLLTCRSTHGQTNGGNLTISIVEATSVEDRDSWGPFARLPDAYFEVDVGGVYRKTSVVSESANPVWPLGGEELWFGAQASGTEVKLKLWDADDGLEFGDDLIAETTLHVADCSCFEEELETCTIETCIEEAWVPLREGENCAGRLHWPWNSESDPTAMCVRIRMKINPFRVDILHVAEAGRTIDVTTASVLDPENPPPGKWGRFYQGQNNLVDPNYPRFAFQKGGLILQMNMLDIDLSLTETFAVIQTNLDAKIYVYRSEEDFDYVPNWLKNETQWSESMSYMNEFGTDEPFRAMEGDMFGLQPLHLGYAGDGILNEAGEPRSNNKMYVVLLLMKTYSDPVLKPYRTAFERSAMAPLLIEMFFCVLPFAILQISFLRRISWRMDRIESGILQAASKDEKSNLISLALKPFYQNGSLANVDFRRNTFYIRAGAQMSILVPIFTCVSYASAIAVLSVPASAGLAVLCLGIGISVIVYCFMMWRISGWRMSRGRLKGFAFGMSSIYIFLFLSVAFDQRVLDAGFPYSIFGLSCVAFALNILPLMAIFLLDNDQLHQAFAQLQKLVNRNAKLSHVRNKFQALGTMGLKMALLSNTMQKQKEEEGRDSNQPDAKKKSGKDGLTLGNLLGIIFTVDDTLDEFSFSDVIRRWFTRSRNERRKVIRRIYIFSVLILIVYAFVVQAKCDDKYKTQGFGLAFAAMILDSAFFALLRGPCMWTPGQYIFLTFAGRCMLTLFSGENWLVGIGLAYFLYGFSLGVEIINRRLRILDSNQAGAIAYFGMNQIKQKRRNDVSVMPEFVLGYLSFVFVIALLGYVFSFDNLEDIPSVKVLGQDWEVWIFGIAAFVVVTVSVVLGLANRALMLQRQGLLKSKSYFMVKGCDVSLQLVALAELLVVTSGLLIKAMTGSTFLFVSAVFFPIIFGACLRVYMQWLANDFHLFQSKHWRGDNEGKYEPDSEISEEEEDHDFGGARMSKNAQAGDKNEEDDDDDDDDYDDDSDEDDDDDDDDDEVGRGGMRRISSFRRSIVSNIKAINEKVVENKRRLSRGSIKVPNVPFRKTTMKAEKVDRDFGSDTGAEEQENVKGETVGVERFQIGVLDVKGEEVSVEAPGKLEQVRSFLNMKKKKLKEKVQSSNAKCKQMYLRKREVAITRFKKFAEISNEEDPTKMNDMEALWTWNLTAKDYEMLRGIALALFLVILYGFVISRTENNFWMGNSIWYCFLLLVFSFVPLRKYYGTQKITPDMVGCFKVSIFLEGIGSLIIFVDILGASVTQVGTLWLLLGFFLWPAFLIALVTLMIWHDSEWQSDAQTLKILRRCFGYFLFCSLVAFVFALPLVGLVLTILVSLSWSMIYMVSVWSENGFFLPLRYQYALTLLLTSAGCFFFVIAFFAATNTAIFFSLTLGFASVMAKLGMNLTATLGNVSKSNPLYFSTFVFPIYSLDPNTNELIDQNVIGILMYEMQLTFLLWGVSCVVFVDPLDFGVGVVAFSCVGMLTFSSFLVCRTPVWMASATLCVHEKEIKAAAQDARKVFEKRRETFEIICEEYEVRDREEAKINQGLNKFASLNVNQQVRKIEFEKRYSAKEMVDVLEKAMEKFVLDRNGKPRRDQAFSFKDALLDSFYTGHGALSPLVLGGGLLTVYEMYQSPAKLRKKLNNKSRYRSVKIYAADIAPDKFVFAGNLLDEDEEKDKENADQLDRLVDELGPGGDVLKVSVYDWDLASANDELGIVEIDLDELESDKVHINWHELEATSEKYEATGSVQIQVEVVNVFGGKSGKEDLQVRVAVLRARGLRAADKEGTSDPFCIVECGTFSRQTPVVYKTLDPEWVDTRGGGRFTFPPTDNTLQVEIRDKDLFTSDFLGGTDIYLPDLPVGEEIVEWYDLEGGRGKTKATGQVKLALLLSMPVDEYGLKKAKASLQVTVVSARGLRAADRGGTSDPFCVAKCGMDAFSTSVIQKTLDPKWAEAYTFNANAVAEEEDGAGEDEFERVDMLDSWKLYLQLPKLDVSLAREYDEEMRALALFQMLLVVASEGRKSKEAILFQRFLREYRFKLLANKIEPPKRIFKSKSWATVDVNLVALWLLRLSPEKRDRFFALKAMFSREISKIEERRIQEDQELARHAKELEDWQIHYDFGKGSQQLHEFAARRAARGEKDEMEGLPEDPEIVVNAREILEKISHGKDTEMVLLEGADETVQMYADPSFPAAVQSYQGVTNEHQIEGWLRARQINPAVEVFSGGTDPDDVFQGVLNNGWFLSALAILAASGSVGDEEVDPLIDRLFISKARSDLGAYAVRLYKNSQWELVIVDDRFPVLKDPYRNDKNVGIACSSSIGFEEMWISILEKAYAKYYGTYTMLENGYVHHALKTLTGFDAEEIFLLEATQGPARTRLWQKLQHYARNGFLMGCGTIANNAANAELMDSGLMFGSCYAIYQVRSIDGHKLLQLRNPPGAQSEWKGDWGDDSELWTTRLKQKLDWTKDDEDGTFWISFDDFCLAFRSLYVCHYFNPKIWSNVEIQSCWKGKTAAGLPTKHNLDAKVDRNPQWILDLQRPLDLHVKVSQLGADGAMASNPQPFTIMLLRTKAKRQRHVRRISSLSKKDLTVWAGHPERLHERHMQASLSPGFYILMVATYDANQEGDFSIRIDSSYKLGVHQLYPRPTKEQTVVIETDLTSGSDVAVVSTKASFKERMLEKAQRKTKRLIKWSNSTKDKIEVFTEKKLKVLDSRIKTQFGLTLREILPGNAVESDDETQEAEAQRPSQSKKKSSWREVFDPNSNSKYFYNEKTGETRWENSEEEVN